MQLVCIRTLPLGRDSAIVIIIVTDMHAQMLQSCMGAAAQRGGSEAQCSLYSEDTMLVLMLQRCMCAAAQRGGD